jgi:hypothetical protein
VGLYHGLLKLYGKLVEVNFSNSASLGITVTLTFTWFRVFLNALCCGSLTLMHTHHTHMFYKLCKALQSQCPPTLSPCDTAVAGYW